MVVSASVSGPPCEEPTLASNGLDNKDPSPVLSPPATPPAGFITPTGLDQAAPSSLLVASPERQLSPRPSLIPRVSSALDIIHESIETVHPDDAIPLLELTNDPGQTGSEAPSFISAVSRGTSISNPGSILGISETPSLDPSSSTTTTLDGQHEKDVRSLASTPTAISARRTSVTFKESPLPSTAAVQDATTPLDQVCEQTTVVMKKSTKAMKRTETMTSYEPPSDADADMDERGRSKSRKTRRRALFRRKKVTEPRSPSASRASSVDAATSDTGRPSKRLSIMDMGNKIMDMMTSKRKDSPPDPRSSPLGDDLVQQPLHPSQSKAEEAPVEGLPMPESQQKLEDKIAHVTRTRSRSLGREETATTDREYGSGRSDQTQTHDPRSRQGRGILKKRFADQSFTDISSLLSDSETPSNFASPTHSSTVSPFGSPRVAMNNTLLPVTDPGHSIPPSDSDVTLSVPGPCLSTMRSSSLTDHAPTKSCGSMTSTLALDMRGDDDASIRTVLGNRPIDGLTALSKCTITQTSPTVVSAGEMIDSTASRTSTVTPPLDQQANDLILGAFNRRTGSNVHKSSSSLGSSKTGGALAALGAKVLGPGLPGAAGGSNVTPPPPAAGSADQAPVSEDKPTRSRRTSLEEPIPATALGSSPPQAESVQRSFTDVGGGNRERGRSQTSRRKGGVLSPFFGRRSLSNAPTEARTSRSRDTSPVGALSEPGNESDGESLAKGYRPKTTSFSSTRHGNHSDGETDDETEYETDLDYDESALSHEVVGEGGFVEDVFDEETEKNTEANAVYFEGVANGDEQDGEGGDDVEVETDVLGEGESPGS